MVKMDKVVPFPQKPKPEIKAPLSITDVENIGFLTKTDRDLWVKRPEDIMKIMLFIVKEKIALIEEDPVLVD